jgi:serine protease AprX
VKRRGIISVVTVLVGGLGLVGGLALSGSQVRFGTSDAQASMDMAVREWRSLQADGRGAQAGAKTQVMIATAEGTRAAVEARLARLANISVTPSSSPDLLVARLDAAGLDAVLGDPDVRNVSSDSPVKGLQLNLKQTLVPLLQKVTNPLDFAASLTATKPSHLLTTLGLANNYGGLWVLNPNTGAGVGVAVIDSGLDQNYTSLDNVDYYDATGGTVRRVYKRADGYGHGTHVGGLLGSNGFSSGGGYRGVAPSAKLVVLKVLGDSGQGSTSDVINAVNYVVANRAALGVKVITMSLGHPIFEPASRDPLVAAVQNAVAKGIVVVVSAGNFGGNPETHETGYAGITSPGNAPSAITVGAVDTKQTDSRLDDQVAWFSSRGPTWYDGFQKPDIVAPGTHLVSNISTASTIYRDYPNGIVKSGAMPFFKMSGTSMSAPVVAGVVANMLQAAEINGVKLTPNTVKAILQYTAIPVAGADTLTQGAGQVNAAGAVQLAGAIKKDARQWEWWMATQFFPFSTIAGERLQWSQRIVWGDHVLEGEYIRVNEPAWGTAVVWGDAMVWGDRITWGQSTVYDGNEEVWGNAIVWGDSLLGTTDGTAMVWGDHLVWGDAMVWGDLHGLGISPYGVLWGSLERANLDLR